MWSHSWYTHSRDLKDRIAVLYRMWWAGLGLKCQCWFFIPGLPLAPISTTRRIRKKDVWVYVRACATHHCLGRFFFLFFLLSQGRTLWWEVVFMRTCSLLLFSHSVIFFILVRVMLDRQSVAGHHPHIDWHVHRRMAIQGNVPSVIKGLCNIQYLPKKSSTEYCTELQQHECISKKRRKKLARNEAIIPDSVSEHFHVIQSKSDH